MPIKHDAQGFLVGDAIDLSKAIKDWASIRSDVQAIKRALLGGAGGGAAPSGGRGRSRPEAKPSAAPSQAGGAAASGGRSRAAVATPKATASDKYDRPRDGAGRFVATPTGKVGGGGGQTPNSKRPDDAAPPAADTNRVQRRQQAQGDGADGAIGAQRDSSGRFVRRDGAAPDPAAPDPGASGGFAAEIASRLATAVRDAGSGLEAVDPAVQAFREVAEPLSRGYELLTGGNRDKRQEGWLRRIYSSMAGLRKEESIFNRAANRSLKNLEDKPQLQPQSATGDAGAGKPGSSFLSGLLSKIPGAGAAAGIAKSLGAGALKRLPLIGALLGTAGAATDIYDSETDDKLTRKEKDERAGGAVGGATGGVAGAIAGGKLGAAAGTVIAGPVGTVVGGLAGAALGGFAGHELGKPLGQAAGNGVSMLRDAKIPEKVAVAWADAKGYLLGASQSAGVDPGTLAKIANYESRFKPDAMPITKDGRKISSAHGYGQFLDGTWTEMVNRYGAKYGVQDAGKLTQEQAAKYRGDKTVQAAMLAEFTRENITKGRKWGGKDDDANVYAFHNLGDGDATKLLRNLKSAPEMSVRDALLAGSTREKERKRVEAVIAGNKGLYGDGNVTVAQAYARMGQKMREGEVFAQDARAAHPQQTQPQSVSVSTSPRVNNLPAWATPSTAHPVTVNSKVPTIPAMPSLPAIPDAPDITVPLASNSGPRQPVTVNTPRQEPGRDLRDRRIAHIVTGGMAGW